MKQQQVYRALKWFQILVVSVLFSSCASLIAPNIKTDLVELKEGQYELDPKHTAVLFKVNHMGFSKFIGRFEIVDASLDFDPENMANSRLEATVDMASVNVNNESFADTLKGNDWFNVESFPQAVFRTTSVNYSRGSEVDFNGDLTFLGVTQPIVLTVLFNGGANNLLTGRYTIGFEAQTSFNRSDFGLDKYMGAVGDVIELEVHAEFQRIR